MDIISALIEQIEPDAEVRDIHVGPYQTAVESVRVGLASTTLPDHHAHGTFSVNDPGKLHELSSGELARLAHSERLLEACIGIAAINSSLRHDESKFRQMHGRDFVSEKAEGKDLTVIGHFPFVKKLSRITKSCRVIEKRPREGDLPEDAAGESIAGSDVVIITGSALSNHTMEGLLGYAKDKYVMVIGPSAPLSSVLFDYGVDVIAGTVVTDPQTVLSGASQGAVYRQLEGVKRMVMEK